MRFGPTRIDIRIALRPESWKWHLVWVTISSFWESPNNVADKLERLKTFYKKALNKVGWNKYSRISLEFNNQIICTKK